MTITYDPSHPMYFDDGDLRHEMNRVYGLCHGCRVCFSLCPSFPTLFDIVDSKENQNVQLMTVAEQDSVVDECFQCKKCYVVCPYTPDQQHEWQLDFPRLMLRAAAQRKKREGRALVDYVFGRTDLVGAMSSFASPIANKVLATPGSAPRKLLARMAGVSMQRMLLPYAKQRFSSWFKNRAAPVLASRQAKVALFPTCVVEYQNPSIGRALVQVFEHNSVACHLPNGVACCGAPWLHEGDFDKFREQAAKNVAPLAGAVKAGYDIVVPSPTCSYVLKKDYAFYMKDTRHAADAALISAHTFDTSEYLWRLHKGDGTEIVTEFPGHVPESTAYHVSCHLQAQNNGLQSRDLIRLTGTRITLVNKCSGIDGTWGYREATYETAKKVAKPLGEAINAAATEVVVGDCALANGGITEETGRLPLHPMEYLAIAYGMTDLGR